MVMTFTYGGIDFWCDFTMYSYKEWEIGDIYLDIDKWPWKDGLYDLLRDDVIEAANDAIFEVCHELWQNRGRDTMDIVKEKLEGK